MNREQAHKAASLIARIAEAERQLKIFENTKEFCKVIFRSENGSEKEYHFETDEKEDVQRIRQYTQAILVSKIVKLSEELDNL